MRTSSNSQMTDAQGKTFGTEMRRLRKEAGLKTAEFAKYVGVTQAYVCNIESGHRKPSPELAVRIANAFDLTVEDMLIPYSEREQAARENYGKALMKRRAEKGYSASLVAGALGIPVAVYKEYEQGLCSIPERNLDTLCKLLGKDEEPKAEEPKPIEVKEEPVEVEDEPVDDMPARICDIILEHVTDLKVDKDVQREVWHYFSRMKLDAEERRLFG